VRSTIVILLLALALAGCTIEVTPIGRAPDPVPGAAAGEVPEGGSGEPDTVDAEPVSVQPDTREIDEATAVSVVNEFWRREFDRQGAVYEPPQVAGGYAGNSGPTCAGEPPVPGNAYYCPPGDFLAWDENLMAAGYDRIGDAWVYLVIAHEWGHAIQARLNRSLVSRAVELQADCLAGAALQGAARENLVLIEEGDDQEIARALRAVADEFPWTDESSHGNADERTASYNRGSRGGVSACL
jgi:predicted metalloprotease